MVIHDSEPEAEYAYKYEPVLSTFKYRYVYSAYKPYTTLVSDTVDVTKFFN